MKRFFVFFFILIFSLSFLSCEKGEDPLFFETERSVPAFENETEPLFETEPEPEIISYDLFENGIILNVPYITQNNAYPNGCECVSTVMVLNAFGHQITVDGFIDGYLSTAPADSKFDPDTVFGGDPRSDLSWGCNSQVIIDSLKKYLGEDAEISSVVGLTLEELCKNYIDAHLPVIVWGTVGMKYDTSYTSWSSNGKRIIYYNAHHCLVLVGYDAEYYYFNDPMKNGKNGEAYIKYPKTECEKCFSLLGNQAIVIGE